MATTTVQTQEQMLQNFAAIKNKKPLDWDAEKNQVVVQGALIGFGGGAFIGYARRYNMLVTGLVGAILGAVISRAFIPSQ